MWSQILRNPSTLTKLKTSKFRRKFFLSETEKQYVKDNIEVLDQFVKHILDRNLKVKPSDDGRQTPYSGNPVYKAQHATATCCRKCIFKWHRIPSYKELNEKEINYLTNIILKWLRLCLK
tara:strand:- start:1162 stop:1521 length:360 start_codon:yes stop_codon:yes gene_type:complete